MVNRVRFPAGAERRRISLNDDDDVAGLRGSLFPFTFPLSSLLRPVAPAQLSCVPFLFVWRRRSTLSGLSDRVFGQFVGTGPMSAPTRSSTRSPWLMESEFAQNGEQMERAPQHRSPHRQWRDTARILGLDWATAISGTDRSFLMLSPIRRTQPTFFFWCGTDQELRGNRRFGKRCGGYMDDNGP